MRFQSLTGPKSLEALQDEIEHITRPDCLRVSSPEQHGSFRWQELREKLRGPLEEAVGLSLAHCFISDRVSTVPIRTCRKAQH